MKTSRHMICLAALLGITLCFTVNAHGKEYNKGEAVYRSNCIM